ncbi:DUF6531 domain-containing protein [Streptomyces sp. NPDC049879]|uniref:DUF6531 domain-containing protein n=2 Tax=unclassified Streptomyces TaxID=2593676 RepID=UPI0037910D4B
MDSDPTPGDPEEVRDLADELQTFSDDVAEALGKVRGLASDRAVQDWAGLSAEAFRSEFDGVPGNLEKLRDSYDLCAQALQTYWPKLQTAQGQADRALDRAIAAQADLTAAQGSLGSAQDWVGRAGDEAERLQREGERADAPAPDEAEVRAATRDRQAANDARDAAQARVDTAQDSLDAARELARQAKEMREEAARQAARDIDEASDAGIHNRKWWQKAVHWVTENWDTIVDICKIVVAVLGVVVMIIGGPLAWVVLAAALVVLADTLVKYANGEASLWDVAFAALDCIPGMKGLTTLGGLARGLRGGLTAARTGLRGLAQGARGLAQGLRRGARPGDRLVCATDPVDMATGEVVMTATDVELPGVLPLVLARHHRSGLREGTWFGRSWASTLDQRLVLAPEGVRLVTDDGMVLDYPPPTPDGPVLPVEGPRWPLAWDGHAGSPMSVLQSATGRTLRFAPVPGRHGGELPLASVTDRNGNVLRLTYDDSGSPTGIRHSSGHHLGITTADGRVTRVNLLSAPDRPVLLRYDYSAHGDLTSVTNSSGLPLLLHYDDRHRITRWEDRNGTWYAYTYDAQGRCVATDGTGGALASRIAYDPATHRTLFTDSLGHTTVYQFNDSYQLVTETDPEGHHTHHTWDRYDRLLTRTDALGGTTHHARDEDGHVIAVTGPDGRSTAYEVDDGGRPTRVTEPDGAVWRQEYDERGNRTAVTDPSGAVTRFGYGPQGALTELTDATGAVTRFETDAAGLPRAVTDAAGAVTRCTRDAFGRITGITRGQGGEHAARSTWEWTVEGRPLRHTDENGAVRSWTWDPEGNCLTHTDRHGGVTAYTYGTFDFVVARTLPDGSRHVFERDTENRLRRLVSPSGLTWELERDALGRVVRETDFDGRVTRWEHDAAGRIVSRTDALGQTVYLARDPSGRVVEKTVGAHVTRFRHDAAGRLVGAVTDDSTLSLVRDALGRVTAETSDGRTVTSTYDALGRRTRRTTPSAVDSVWTYTPTGAPATLATSGHILAFDYDDRGRETTREITGGPVPLVLTHAWDPAGHLTGQSVLRGGRTVQQRTYDWRADDHLVGVHDHDTGTTRYERDALGRPLSVTAPGAAETYAYDPDGNQTAAHTRDGGDTAGERRHEGMRLRAAGRTRYSYDEAGRVVLRRVRTLSGKLLAWHFTWDAEDRLTGVITPDGSRWTYGHDPLGRRVSKQRVAPDGREGERTEFVWDGPTLAERITSPGGRPGEASVRTTTWNHHAHQPLTQLDRRERRQEETDRRFLAIVTDLVGTPTHLLDETGATAWRADGTVWGSDRGTDGEDFPLRFPGQYADDETGWHHNVHRHYDPDTARFATPDPLGLTPSPNPYGYVRDPHSWSDPLGLTPCRAAAREQALRDAGVPDGAEPLEVRHTPSTKPNGKQILDDDYQPVMFYEEVHINNRDELIVYQDHHTGHSYGDPNGIGDQPPHVHVRPYDDPRNGQIPGAEEHYYYDPSLG